MRTFPARFLRGPEAEELIALITYAALGLALLPLVWAAILGAADRRWSEVLFYGALVAIICLSVARYRRNHRRGATPITTTEFQPFVDPKDLKAWPRPTDLAAVTAALSTEAHRLPVLVGASGSGKSVLLKKLLPESLEGSGAEIFYVEGYADFRMRLTARVDAHRRAAAIDTSTLIVVLDQFEQYLANLRSYNADDREAERLWLRGLLAADRASTRIHFIICVRSEWFYDLRWLGSLIPSPAETLSLRAALVTPDSDSAEAILSRLEIFTHDRDTARAIIASLALERSGRPMPLEVQIVGAHLERLSEAGGVIDQDAFKQLGGVRGAIDAYFEGILSGAPDRRVALKVLCALSVRTQFRKQEDLARLLDCLFESNDDVIAAIKYLVDERLIKQSVGGRYELTHDYLAAYFHEKSGAELNPFDRDNVLFHFDNSDRPTSGAVVPRAKREKAGATRPILGRSLILPLAALLVVRLLGFGLPLADWGSEPAPRYLLPDKELFDLAYLPIFVVHLSWALYTWLFYDRVFFALNERPWARLLSRLTVINMVLSIVATMFFPFAWLLAIGWAGSLFGVKIVLLSRMSNVSEAARTRLKELGFVTLANLLFLSGIGAIWLWVGVTFVGAEATDAWIYANGVLCVMMTYTCMVLAPNHVTRPGVARLLGLLARSPSAIEPRLDLA